MNQGDYKVEKRLTWNVDITNNLEFISIKSHFNMFYQQNCDISPNLVIDYTIIFIKCLSRICNTLEIKKLREIVIDSWNPEKVDQIGSKRIYSDLFF